MNSLPERFFSADGYAFDLEELADTITRKESPDTPKSIILTGTDGITHMLTVSESQRRSLFSEITYSEGALNLRLALTRYFLQTGRPLLPEMSALLVEGITAHMKHGKPWGRPNVKPRTDSLRLMAVLAIANKFRGKRADIAAALEISTDGVNAIIQKAKVTAKCVGAGGYLRVFEEYMPPKFEDALKLLDRDHADEFIRINGVKLY